MKIAVLGSGNVARDVFGALVEAGRRPCLVVTQPARRRRRRGHEEPTPVQAWAEAASLDVVAPERVNDADSLDRLRAAGADLFVVAEYGQILSQSLLDIPRQGAINVHTSLLPRHRGAAPVAAAILAGDTETGVTIQRVVKELDAGPILAARSLEIRDDDDAGSLTARIADLARGVLVEVVEAFATGNPPEEIAQDDSLATYVKRFKAEDRDLDFGLPARDLWLRVRALAPKPGARTALLRDEPLPLGVSRAAHVAGTAPPGEVVEVCGDALRVGTGAGLLELVEVLPAGRRPMSGAAFWNGFHVARRERLGRPSKRGSSRS